MGEEQGYAVFRGECQNEGRNLASIPGGGAKGTNVVLKAGAILYLLPTTLSLFFDAYWHHIYSHHIHAFYCVHSFLPYTILGSRKSHVVVEHTPLKVRIPQPRLLRQHFFQGCLLLRGR